MSKFKVTSFFLEHSVYRKMVCYIFCGQRTNLGVWWLHACNVCRYDANQNKLYTEKQNNNIGYQAQDTYRQI